MIKAASKPRPGSASTKHVIKELHRLRQETEDLLDLLEGLEARARNLGKPRLTHQEVLAKFGLK